MAEVALSNLLFQDDVLFLQRLLRSEGLYLDTLDGVWGAVTEAAAERHEEAAKALRVSLGTFDSRSERNIATLSLKAQREARLFLSRQIKGGLLVRIISGTRTYAEQNELFKKGRFGNLGPVVTNVRGGYSNHNFGIAWDIGVFTASGGYLSDGPEYAQAAKLGLASPVEWGGNWKTILDRPHFQLALGLGVSQLRTAFETGDKIASYALD